METTREAQRPAIPTTLPTGTMKEVVEKMDAQLQTWGKKIDERVVKAKNASKETKEDLFKRIDDLKFKRQAAQAKLNEIRAAGADKWEGLKTGLEVVWKDLEIAFRELKE